MTATAYSDGLRNEVDINGRHTIITDEPERLGGTDEGPAPHELMAAMLAACASTTVQLYAESRHWELREVRVEVEYDPDSTPRHARLRLCLPGGLTDDQIKRLRNVANSCPARRALEAGFTFEEETVVPARR